MNLSKPAKPLDRNWQEQFLATLQASPDFRAEIVEALWPLIEQRLKGQTAPTPGGGSQ